MLCNSYNSKKILRRISLKCLRGDIKLLLVTVNNRLMLEIEIVHDLSCHPIFTCHIFRDFMLSVLLWTETKGNTFYGCSLDTLQSCRFTKILANDN